MHPFETYGPPTHKPRAKGISKMEEVRKETSLMTTAPGRSTSAGQ